MSRQQPDTSTSHQSRQKRSSSPLKRKIRSIRDSKRRRKKLQHAILVVAAVVIAFILGYFFFGPSFSSGE